MKDLRVGPRVAAIALSVAAVALLLTVPAEAARGRNLRARGVVEAISTDTAPTVTVELPTHVLATYALTAQTQVVVEGEASTLASVFVGDQVVVDYTVTATGPFPVVKLQAWRPRGETFGLVTDVVKNEDGSVSVTVDSPFEDPDVLQATEDSQAKVEGHGKLDLVSAEDPDLAGLKGMYAAAVYLKGSLEVDAIVFQKPRRLPYRGVVKSVDAAANTFVLVYHGKGKDKDTDYGKALSLVVAFPSTIVKFNGKQVTNLNDVQPGDLSEGLGVMVLDQASGAVSNVATHAFFKWPRPVEFAGTITAKEETVLEESVGTVPNSLGTLTLQLRNGAALNVVIYSNTTIKLAGKSATLTELQVGQKCAGSARPRPAGDGTRYDGLRVIAKKLPPASRPTGGTGG